MALLGNRTVLQKSLATFRNGTSTAGAYAGVVLNNFTNSGTNRNIYFSEVPMQKFSAVPVGYLPPYCWVIPRTSGGLGSTGKIKGVGTLTPPDIQLIKSIAATIAGTGAITPPILEATYGIFATLSGSGAITDADMNALAVLEAEITPFTGLTPENIASGILDDQNVETGLTVRQALRLLAAALAGELSGAAGTTITIRNAVADDKDRIIATVDSNGNRSAITYDVT